MQHRQQQLAWRVGCVASSVTRGYGLCRQHRYERVWAVSPAAFREGMGCVACSVTRGRGSAKLFKHHDSCCTALAEQSAQSTLTRCRWPPGPLRTPAWEIAEGMLRAQPVPSLRAQTQRSPLSEIGCDRQKSFPRLQNETQELKAFYLCSNNDRPTTSDEAKQPIKKIGPKIHHPRPCANDRA